MSDSSSPHGAAFADEFRRGFRDIAPLLLGVVPFALLFGTLAARKGLSPLETVLMSATTYAGGAQFVSIDVWETPVPVLAVILATALANTRYILMGAALRPHILHLPWLTRIGFVSIHSDETWALALQRSRQTTLTPGYVLGLTLIFYLNWPLWCGIGAVLGGAVENPSRFGADFMFVAMFLCLIRGMWQGRSSLIAILGSACCALIAYHSLLGHWYIFIGALGGMLAVILFNGTTRRQEQAQ